jgi:hypothetical protein
MAKRSGLSKSTIGRIWKAFHLKPHLADTFKLSTDPLFVGSYSPSVSALCLFGAPLGWLGLPGFWPACPTRRPGLLTGGPGW